MTDQPAKSTPEDQTGPGAARSDRKGLQALPARLLRLLVLLRPPRQWNVPVLLLLGTFGGLAAMTFHVSRATSYLTDDPAACVNCHIMAPQYASWQHSSHARVTTCNDCHVPQDNVFRSYAFKAYDGLRHATMFTFKLEPQVIRMHAPGQRVVQENCIRCHSQLMETSLATTGVAVHGEDRKCWDCHRDVPHGRVNSLASAPHAQVPRPSPVLPAWLAEQLGASPPVSAPQP
jgi:cytochrome c nitrite reductase small subunit